MIEEWRRLEENYDYEVSNLGRVRSHLLCGRGYHSPDQPYYLTPVVMTRGVLAVSVRIKDIVVKCAISKLVAKYFIGPCPRGHRVLHRDGVVSNNVWTNLYYGVPNAKLTATDIRRLRAMSMAGYKAQELGVEFGISKHHAQRILNRRSWKWLP